MNELTEIITPEDPHSPTECPHCGAPHPGDGPHEDLHPGEWACHRCRACGFQWATVEPGRIGDPVTIHIPKFERRPGRLLPWLRSLVYH